MGKDGRVVQGYVRLLSNQKLGKLEALRFFWEKLQFNSQLCFVVFSPLYTLFTYFERHKLSKAT